MLVSGFCFMNLTQTRVDLGEGISNEKMPPSECCVSKSGRHFFLLLIVNMG